MTVTNNQINWTANPNSTSLVSFNVYRSFCGTVSEAAPFPTSIVNEYIRLQTATINEPKTIKIKSNDINSIVEELNKVPGVYAQTNSTNDKIEVRSTDGFLKIYPSTGATLLGLQHGSYNEKKIWVNIASVPFVPGQSNYFYEDVRSHRKDWYYVTSVNTDNEESLPSILLQHIENYLNVCCLEGQVVDIHGGQPMQGKKVFVKLFDGHQEECQFSISERVIETYTDEYGRWRISVPRKITIFLEIPETKYSCVLKVPDQACYYFKNFEADDVWRYSNYAMPAIKGYVNSV